MLRSKQKLRQWFRADDGTSMVEFAIMAPVLIFLVIGLIEIGRYTYFSIVAANAARAGAQYGSQSLQTAGDSPGMRAAAIADGGGLSNWSGGVAANYLCSVSGGAPTACATGSSSAPTNTIYYITVRVTGTFTTLLHYPGIPTNVPVTGSATMRVATQ